MNFEGRKKKIQSAPKPPSNFQKLLPCDFQQIAIPVHVPLIFLKMLHTTKDK